MQIKLCFETITGGQSDSWSCEEQINCPTKQLWLTWHVVWLLPAGFPEQTFQFPFPSASWVMKGRGRLEVVAGFIHSFFLSSHTLKSTASLILFEKKKKKRKGTTFSAAAAFIGRNVWFQTERPGATVESNAVSPLVRKLVGFFFFTSSVFDTRWAAAAFITYWLTEDILNKGWQTGISISNMLDVFHWFMKAGLNYIKHKRASNSEGRIADQSSLRYQRKQIMFAPYRLCCLGIFNMKSYSCKLESFTSCNVGVILGTLQSVHSCCNYQNLQYNLHVLCGDLTVWCGSWGFHEASAALRTDRLSLVREKGEEIGLYHLWRSEM